MINGVRVPSWEVTHSDYEHMVEEGYITSAKDYDGEEKDAFLVLYGDTKEQRNSWAIFGNTYEHRKELSELSKQFKSLRYNERLTYKGLQTRGWVYPRSNVILHERVKAILGL